MYNCVEGRIRMRRMARVCQPQIWLCCTPQQRGTSKTCTWAARACARTALHPASLAGVCLRPARQASTTRVT